MSSREEAERKVRDGEALARDHRPGDTLQKLESTLDQPTLEVIVNEEDPLKGRLVDDTITAAVAEANRQRVPCAHPHEPALPGAAASRAGP